MKKHELLEKAMRDYPVGINYISPFSGTKFTSKGVFVLHMKGVVEIGEGEIFDGDKWAEIIPSEPIKFNDLQPATVSAKKMCLDLNSIDEPLKVENLAVITHDLSQFDSVYLSLSKKRISYIEFGYKFPLYVYLSDKLTFDKDINSVKERGYKIIDFDIWAVQNNIQVPKPILRSEDGVDLYEGDGYIEASKNSASGVWEYIKGPEHFIKDTHRVIMAPDNSKAFVSKEAAEAWIEKNNKPKSISFETKSLIINITAKGFKAEAKSDTRTFYFTKTDIDRIVADMKSLQ